jgi:hypothetical protein
MHPDRILSVVDAALRAIRVVLLVALAIAGAYAAGVHAASLGGKTFLTKDVLALVAASVSTCAVTGFLVLPLEFRFGRWTGRIRNGLFAYAIVLFFVTIVTMGKVTGEVAPRAGVLLFSALCFAFLYTLFVHAWYRLRGLRTKGGAGGDEERR